MRNLHFKLPFKLAMLATIRNSIEELSGHPNGQDAFSIYPHTYKEVVWGLPR